jgi:hypothetical protein
MADESNSTREAGGPGTALDHNRVRSSTPLVLAVRSYLHRIPRPDAAMISLRSLASVVLGLVLVTTPTAQAAPMQREAVPAPLQPWIDWVLHDQPSAF